MPQRGGVTGRVYALCRFGYRLRFAGVLIFCTMKKNKKLGQEPAFAVAAFGDGEGVYEPGMSKRFYAACNAMKGLIANNEFMNNAYNKSKLMGCSFESIVVDYSYNLADELLKQENE